MEDDAPPPSPYVKKPSLWLWMIVGIPLCLLSMVLVGWVWILPDLHKGDSSIQTLGCLTNLDELAIGLQTYASDFDDNLPEQGWNDKIRPYFVKKKVPDVPLLFACPVQRRMDPESSGYALNREAAGRKLHSLEPMSDTPLVFDSSDVQPSAVEPTESLPSPGRHEHGRKNNVVYADGSAKTIAAR